MSNTNTLNCGHLSYLESKGAASVLERCTHVFDFLRGYSQRGRHGYYRKGIAAANARTAANLPPVEVLTLERMADNEKAREFDRLARAVDWSAHRPVHLARVIDMALSLDMIALAKELAWRGSVAFPENVRLQRAAAVLSPRVAVKTSPAQSSHVDGSQQWLKEHGVEYKGQWVAVKNGTLLGVAPTLKQLHQQIGPEGKTLQTVIIKVLSED